MRKADIGLLLILAVLWGASFCFARQALRDLPPLSVTAARFGLAGLIFGPVLLAARQRLPRGWRHWRDFLAMGVLNNLLPFGLIALGQQWIGAGMAAILNSTAPLFSALIAPLLVAEERPSARRLVGVALGFAGVALLAGPAALGRVGYPWWALLPGLGAALSYALAAIWGLRFRGLPVMSIAASQVMSAAVLGVPLALAIDRPWRFDPAPATWAALLGMALFTTVLGYLIYFRLLVRSGPTNALLVTFLIPPAAAALEAMLFGASLPWLALPAMATILLGIACVTGRLPVRLPRKAATAL